jgi:hypothetical protein
MFRANHYASGLQSNIHAMGAVIAFGGSVIYRIDVKSIIGAGLRTCLTSYAAVLVKVNDPVVSCVQGGNGAYFHTGSIRTVVAAHH